MERLANYCARIRARPRVQWAGWAALAGSRNPPSEVLNKKIEQKFALLRGWLELLTGVERHLVNELVLVRRNAIDLALHEQRDLAELELAIGAKSRLRRPYSLGITDGARALDLALDFLLVGVAQAAVYFLDTVGKSVNVDAPVLADGLHDPLDAAYRRGAITVVSAEQHAEARRKLAGDWAERVGRVHGHDASSLRRIARDCTRPRRVLGENATTTSRVRPRRSVQLTFQCRPRATSGSKPAARTIANASLSSSFFIASTARGEDTACRAISQDRRSRA